MRPATVARLPARRRLPSSWSISKSIGAQRPAAAGSVRTSRTIAGAALAVSCSVHVLMTASLPLRGSRVVGRSVDLRGAGSRTRVLLEDDSGIVRAGDAGPAARGYGGSAMQRALLRRFEDRQAWPPRPVDWLIVAAWLVVGALDVALENDQGLSFTNPDPTPWPTWPFLAVFAATVLLRRRAPLQALLLAYGAFCACALTGGALDKGFVPVLQVAYLTFWAGRAAGSPGDVRAVFALGAAGGVAAAASSSPGFDVGAFAWATTMLTVLPLVAARAFRHHERLTELLRERAASLEVQRDERARLAGAEERERIAGELHDVIAHGVSAMVVQATAARRLVAAHGDTEAGREAIAQVEASGRAALDELRRLLGVLRRGDDDALALAPQPSLARVDRLVERLRSEGLPVELAVEGAPAPLPAGLDVTAYRIVEEALSDVLRQDGAAQTRVAVRYGARELELEVSDDGG